MNIPRYVDSSEETGSYDIYASMFGGIPVSELAVLDSYWEVFPSLKENLFTGDDEYVSVKNEDIKTTIRNNLDVQNFLGRFHSRFADFGEYLDKNLIDQSLSLSIPKMEEQIASDLFDHFSGIPILDPYQAYESFEEKYSIISGDLELVQSEGIDTFKKVDPNMVVKKQKGKEVEVQEGWKGHAFEFELVQEFYLSEQLNALSKKRDELAEIPHAYEELIETLSEDDKNTISDALNESNDEFVFKNIKGVIKVLKEDEADNKVLIQILKSAQSLNDKEKSLKKQIKEEETSLHLLTKETIENFSDEDVRQLLHKNGLPRL